MPRGTAYNRKAAGMGGKERRRGARDGRQSHFMATGDINLPSKPEKPRHKERKTQKNEKNMKKSVEKFAGKRKCAYLCGVLR